MMGAPAESRKPMKSLQIVMPIPSHDFDPTEVAVTWKVLRHAGHTIHFATPDGKRGHADPRMVTGEGPDPWGWMPGLNKLRVPGLLLRADRQRRLAHEEELARDPPFLQPRRYSKLSVNDCDALVLPGGHAQGMMTPSRREWWWMAPMFQRDGRAMYTPLRSALWKCWRRRPRRADGRKKMFLSAFELAFGLKPWQ